MVIHAVYENGVFRPMEPVALPESSHVELVIQQKPIVVDSHTTAASPLSNLAGMAASYPENPNLPADLAEQHDHYLYGTVKR